MQLQHTVNPELLYRYFWYKSGINPQMVEALSDVVESAQARRPFRKGELAIDIGCNDGTLLTLLPKGVRLAGYDPCLPLANLAKQRTGGEIQATYFDKPHPEKAALIFTCAMFYDVENPRAFVENIRDSLLPDGIWVNQMNHLGAMLATGAVDNVCFEHLTYWNILGFVNCCFNAGLFVNKMEFNEVNGGSVRTYASRSMVPLIPLESHGPDLSGWAAKTKRRMEQLHQFVGTHPGILGYGASTRGMTILQAAGIGPELLPAIADRNPDKVGRLTCNGIHIISEEEMRKRRPEYLLALPYHFIEGFVKREQTLLEHGTRFVLPDLTMRGLNGAVPARRSTA